MKSSTPSPALVCTSASSTRHKRAQPNRSGIFPMVLFTGLSVMLALTGSLLVLVSGLAIGLGKLVGRSRGAQATSGNSVYTDENIRSLYQGDLARRTA